MNAWVLLGVGVALAVAGAALTGYLRTRLLAAAVLDHPNARSLHCLPVPRGGGLAIALGVLGVHVVGMALIDALTLPNVVWGLAAAAFAAVGWFDDVASRPVHWRLLAQFVAGAIFIAAWLPVPEGAGVGWMLLTGTGTLLAVTWLVNLYNFMDGADGFAATQALFAALGGLLLTAPQPLAALVLAALAGACAGFLCWNRPPARIFMGDCGSYFIGFQLAALALVGWRDGTTPAVWLLLLLPFVVDASLTLARRVLAGEAFWRAHRSHAYQRLVLGGWSVARLLGSLVAFNLLIGWPLAWCAQQGAALPAVAAGVVITGLAWWRVVRRLPAA